MSIHNLTRLSVAFTGVLLISSLVTAATNATITTGQRVFTCGHSFHLSVPPLLEELARAAGYTNHTQLGVSPIGGSRVIQHWEARETPAGNAAQNALRSGTVDVLTLSPIWLPDEGLANFAKLASEHNPRVRVTVQEFWLPYDEYSKIYPLDKAEKPVNRNATDLKELRRQHELYFHDVDEHVRELNKQLGRTVLYVVPVGQAVLALREKVVAGQAFGVKTQAELFGDNLGHAWPLIPILNTYCHYAVIYRRSPVGLPMPQAMATAASTKQGRWTEDLNRLLQQIAWDAVIQHPLSGVK